MYAHKPGKVPSVGFYYHYKHDPNGDLNNYAYEVLGFGCHTEEDARLGEEHFVVYRPLYDAPIYKLAKETGTPCFDLRPLEMWMSTIQNGGVVIPRFRKITDPVLTAQLGLVREEMYPE